MLPQWAPAADQDSDLESVEGLTSGEEKTYYSSFKSKYGHHLDSLRRALSRRNVRILIGVGVALLLLIIVGAKTDWHHVKTKVHELTAEEKAKGAIPQPVGEEPQVSPIISVPQPSSAVAAPEPSLDTSVWPVQVPSNIKSIQNATLGFEKILVINLPMRTDKKDRITLGAAVSNMSLEFVDGVLSTDVSDRARPFQPAGTKQLEKGYLGSWRAHMNALQTVVAQNLSTALIMEDDIDWDIRIHDQLEAFAVGSRYVFDQTVYDSYNSPYGDGWDLFWLGHCSERGAIPNTRIFEINDPTTVSVKNYHDNWAKGTMRGWKDHTRKVYFSENPICTYSYAVSQQGARKLLWYLNLKEVTENYDLMLANWCNKKKHPDAKCLTTSPPYFVAHNPRGNAAKLSDNTPQNDRNVEHSFTFNIRLSVMNNLEKLVEGDSNLIDYYPDDAPPGSVGNPYR